MGKSELVKTYAKKNEKKYTNIIHLFYGGDLKKCVAHMEFSDDTADMSEEMLFDKHMRILKKLHSDSLIIIDNFNVLPKEDAFFKEFIKLNCKILVTSRCNISQYETIKISEMDADTELIELFYKHCPSAKSSQDVVKEIIQTIGCHTLTVFLSALSLTASGLEPEELLAELKTCGLNITSGEDVELYKDDDFTDGLMMEHIFCYSCRMCSHIWTSILYQITCPNLLKESAMLWKNTSWSLLVIRHCYWIIRQNVFC